MLVDASAAKLSTQSSSIMLWHMRLGKMTFGARAEGLRSHHDHSAFDIIRKKTNWHRVLNGGELI